MSTAQVGSVDSGSAGDGGVCLGANSSARRRSSAACLIMLMDLAIAGPQSFPVGVSCHHLVLNIGMSRCGIHEKSNQAIASN